MCLRGQNAWKRSVCPRFDRGNVPSVPGLSGLSSDSFVTSFPGYNPYCQVSASTQGIGSEFYNFQYQYNLAGELTQEAYPSGRVVNYTPDSAGRTVSVAGMQGGVATTYATIPAGGYWPHGAIQTLTLGNGVTETTVYNLRLQMITMTAKRNNATLLGLSYGFSTGTNNGNVQSQTIQNDAVGSEPAFSVTQTYTSYDGVNRLAGFSENGHSQTYGYDAYGNRWVSASDAVYPASPLTPTQQSAYDATTNRFLVTTNCATGSSTGYDQRGNLQSQCPFSLSYDGENRQVSATSTTPSVTATYGYDGNG